MRRLKKEDFILSLEVNKVSVFKKGYIVLLIASESFLGAFPKIN